MTVPADGDRPLWHTRSVAGLVVVIRHGQTEWSATGRHTGVTDVPLTPDGRAQARELAPRLAGRRFALVLVSPRIRARDTAELAGLGDRAEIEPNLVEWDYGDYEGLTTPQIREQVAGWTVWTHPCPGGETAAEVGARADAVLDRVRPALGHGDVALVAHGHLLRVLAARWLGWPPEAGVHLLLDPSTLGELGDDRGVPALARWNG